MESMVRGVLAAVLQGPANLMAAYRALVEKFGDNYQAAADYVWSSQKGSLSKTAKAEDFVRLPKGDVLKLPPVHAVEPSQRRSILDPPSPRSVNLQDAADTVAGGIASDEKLRALYSEVFSDYHEVDEEGRRLLVESFLEDPKMKRQLEITPESGMWRDLSKVDLSNFHQEFLEATEAMSSPERIYQIFKEQMFKALFTYMYRAMKRKIESGTSKWASEGFEDMSKKASDKSATISSVIAAYCGSGA